LAGPAIGRIRADSVVAVLGAGLSAVDAAGRYVSPSLFVVGPVIRGVHFYSNSIETTMTNAANMAKAVMGSLVRSRTSREKRRIHEPRPNDGPRVHSVQWPEDAVAVAIENDAGLLWS
jgi:hypothetical protein